MWYCHQHRETSKITRTIKQWQWGLVLVNAVSWSHSTHHTITPSLSIHTLGQLHRVSPLEMSKNMHKSNDFVGAANSDDVAVQQRKWHNNESTASPKRHETSKKTTREYKERLGKVSRRTFKVVGDGNTETTREQRANGVKTGCTRSSLLQRVVTACTLWNGCGDLPVPLHIRAFSPDLWEMRQFCRKGLEVQEMGLPIGGACLFRSILGDNRSMDALDATV
jgi:hypothetical protein